ncbi:MAG: magnesium transporter [Gammaproteobacteria bacterium]
MESAKKTDLGLLLEALEDGRLDSAREIVAALHPAEVALILESLPPSERPVVWKLCDEEDEGDILAELNDEVRTRLAEDVGTEAVVAATEGLEIDDLADIVADLPNEMSDRVKESLSSEDLEQLESVLSFPEDSAGGLMDPDTRSVRTDVTLEVVMRYLRRAGDLPDQTPAVFVVDRDDKYIGVLYFSRLVTHHEDCLVGDVMDDSVEPIHADETAVEVATVFQARDLVAAAVVDDDGRLLGQITVDDVMDVIQEQADHDILSMAGLDEEDDMFAPVVTSTQRRAIWLGVNLATAFLASAVVALFRPALEQVVILAILMPIVASMGGIAGSQTLTLMIRGMALGRVEESNARTLLRKEIAVGLLNGLLWAVVVAAVTITLFNSSWEVGVIIGSSLIISLFAAALAGFAIPLILNKMRIDPALAGTVVLTTITDVIGFATFLGLGTLFLT